MSDNNGDAVDAAVMAYGLVSYEAGKKGTPEDGLPELAAVRAAVERACADAYRDALACVCGHRWEHHDGHTYSPPGVIPSHCSQGDGCMIFTPSEKVLMFIRDLERQRGGAG